MSRNPMNAAQHLSGACALCGAIGPFQTLPGASLREASCGRCGATTRNRDVAQVVVQALLGEDTPLAQAMPRLAGAAIFEAQCEGALHEALKGLPGYVCSEYLPGVPTGATDSRGIRCEDLQSLTFADASFDVVITQDVLEHVADPERAFLEIRRVLKPGGSHVFTVPVHEGRPTTTRFVGPRSLPVWHEDPLAQSGAPVRTDFGDDLPRLLEPLGFITEAAVHRGLYPASAMPWIHDDTEHERYLAARTDPLRYFFYNSLVYRSRKTAAPEPEPLRWTGERFVPWVDEPTVALEHLHRYRLAQRAAAGRRVLDLACGEGYGSFILSQTARSVVGLDLDAVAVRHATFRYRRPNLNYVAGSMLDVPIPGRGVFDLIVCYEALEHVSDHERLLSEVKRLLSPDGVFLVSTPHKEIYNSQPGYTNPYHVRELPFADFRDLLARRFKNASFCGQNVFHGSVLFPLESGAGPAVQGTIRRCGGEYQYEELTAPAARYFVAAASDAPLDPVVCPAQSGLFDLSPLDQRPATPPAPEPPPTELRLDSGFHPDEGGWRWMDRTGRLLLPSALLPARLRFRLTSSDASHYDSFPFHVAVLVDGVEQGRVNFDASQQDRDVALELPAEDAPAVRVVELASSQSFVPASKGLGSDVRRLSVRFTGPTLEALNTGDPRMR